MDIKRMQSVMLANGLRVADDDPIFSVVTLVELAVNEANSKHLEQMRIIADPILTAAEVLTIGRQFLSGENEQILDDVNSIKRLTAAIAQQIANNTIQDKDRLINVIKTIDGSLLKIVHSISDSKSALEARNEAYLICSIKEIKEAVQQVKDIETLLQSALRDHIDSLMRPSLQQIIEQVKILSNEETGAMSLMKKTNDTQNELAGNIGFMCAGISLLLVLTFAAGYWLRPVLSG